MNQKTKTNKPLYITLILLFVATWIWSAIAPLHPEGWWLENKLVVVFVVGLIWISRHFIFSNTSYILLTIFMILHVIGSHYTYAEVPFGVTIGELMGEERNMYDRLVHALFGVVFVYPLYEYLTQKSNLKGLLSYMFAFMTIAAFAGIYEIIEWLTVWNVDTKSGALFLGAQGDIWDAQKDMALAMVGSFVVLIFIGIKEKFKS